MFLLLPSHTHLLFCIHLTTPSYKGGIRSFVLETSGNSVALAGSHSRFPNLTAFVLFHRYSFIHT